VQRGSAIADIGRIAGAFHQGQAHCPINASPYYGGDANTTPVS
jgi:hypothetical protein